MKILALNSSPRTGGESLTELMLGHLTAGMTAAGAKVEIINLRQKTIKNCIGCFWLLCLSKWVFSYKNSRENEIRSAKKNIG